VIRNYEDFCCVASDSECTTTCSARQQIQSNLNHGVTSTYSVLLTLNARAVHGNRFPALIVMRVFLDNACLEVFDYYHGVPLSNYIDILLNSSWEWVSIGRLCWRYSLRATRTRSSLPTTSWITATSSMISSSSRR
jgi:hypothetical protein